MMNEEDKQEQKIPGEISAERRGRRGDIGTRTEQGSMNEVIDMTLNPPREEVHDGAVPLLRSVYAYRLHRLRGINSTRRYTR